MQKNAQKTHWKSVDKEGEQESRQKDANNRNEDTLESLANDDFAGLEG